MKRVRFNLPDTDREERDIIGEQMLESECEITMTLDELQLHELPQEDFFTEEEGNVQVGTTIFN